MSARPKPRLVGINHVALEVHDVGAAFVELGDQFIALMEGRSQPPDTTRHFGLVVDDKEATRRALEEAGAKILPSRRFLDFLDPSGNRLQVVQYDQIRFAKTDEVLRKMGLDASARPRPERVAQRVRASSGSSPPGPTR